MAMEYSIDQDGHLDLSRYFLGFGYDMFQVRDVSHDYFFAELTRPLYWNGLPVIGLNSEAKWRHLICVHGRDGLPLNPIMDIELERVKRLPLIPKVLDRRIDLDIFRQTNRRGKEDSISVVATGPDINYLVTLGALPGKYIFRSAYPAGSKYVGKIWDRVNRPEKYRKDGITQLVERYRN